MRIEEVMWGIPPRVQWESFPHGRDERKGAECCGVERKEKPVSKRVVVDEIRLSAQKTAGDRDGVEGPCPPAVRLREQATELAAPLARTLHGRWLLQVGTGRCWIGDCSEEGRHRR
jgi:hypothetical protein